MAISKEEKRVRRAAKRAAEGVDAGARGQRKPSGREPDGCYWDPRPGEPTGTWRKLNTHEAYDPAAHERARNAARRHAKGARATRIHREPLGDAAVECNSPSRRSSCKRAASPPSSPQS